MKASHVPTALRVIAATLGAYVLTALATTAASLLLARIGLDPVEAITAASLGSFTFFAIVAMATWHARSMLCAWLWLGGLSCAAGLTIWILAGA